MRLHFTVGVRRESTLLTPPGVPKPLGEYAKLAESDMGGELGGERYVSLAFPVIALNGRVGPKDQIEIHVSTPDETPLMDQEAIKAVLAYIDGDAFESEDIDRATAWLQSKLPTLNEGTEDHA